MCFISLSAWRGLDVKSCFLGRKPLASWEGSLRYNEASIGSMISPMLIKAIATRQRKVAADTQAFSRSLGGSVERSTACRLKSSF